MHEGSADGLPVWARPEPGVRQSRFSRDQIAAAALAIADAGGFEAVSMRRIAAALGAGTMSLYRYVSTKAELLALIDDAILGAALVPGDLPADWRSALAEVARRTRRAYLDHPWAVPALLGSPAARASPNGLRHFEQSLTALAGAPLTTRRKLDLLAIVDDYVFGHLLHAAGHSRADDGAAAEATREFVAAQLGSGEFPRLAALADEPETDAAAEERFELGLRLLIDGMPGQDDG